MFLREHMGCVTQKVKNFVYWSDTLEYQHYICQYIVREWSWVRIQIAHEKTPREQDKSPGTSDLQSKG